MLHTIRMKNYKLKYFIYITRGFHSRVRLGSKRPPTPRDVLCAGLCGNGGWGLHTLCAHLCADSDGGGGVGVGGWVGCPRGGWGHSKH